MTREETKELIKVIQAYVDGKDIECWDEYNEKWELVGNPSWNTDKVYRIKPETIYRPFKSAQECIEELKNHEPFGWVKNQPNAGYYFWSISGIRCDGVVDFIYIRDVWCSADTIFAYYTFLDGTPFGIKEE